MARVRALVDKLLCLSADGFAKYNCQAERRLVDDAAEERGQQRHRLIRKIESAANVMGVQLPT